MNTKNRKSLGYTLIEILIVISIIGILVAIGVVSYQRTTKLTRDSRRQSDLEQIRQALETYRSENGVYPAVASLTSELVPDYINTFPTDPKNGTYLYKNIGGTPRVQYRLCAYLELGQAIATGCNTFNCGPSGEVCNYEANNP